MAGGVGGSPTAPAHAVYGLAGGFILGNSVLTNLERPSQSWHSVRAMRSDNASIGTVINSFEGITDTRFSLQVSDLVIFEEFSLGEPD
jgi:hypothetical protein